MGIRLASVVPCGVAQAVVSTLSLVTGKVSQEFRETTQNNSGERKSVIASNHHRRDKFERSQKGAPSHCISTPVVGAPIVRTPAPSPPVRPLPATGFGASGMDSVAAGFVRGQQA